LTEKLVDQSVVMTTGEKDPAQAEGEVKWLYPGANPEAQGQSSSQADTSSLDSSLDTDQSVNGSDQGEKDISSTSEELPTDPSFMPEDLGKQVAAASNYVGSFFNPAAWKQTETEEGISGSSFFSSISKVSGLTKSSTTSKEIEEAGTGASAGGLFSSAFNKMNITKMASSLTMDNISGKVAAVAGATYPDTPPSEEVEGAEDTEIKDESWGYTSFTSAFNKASKVATDYSKVIQESVNKAPMLAEFNQEQQEFIRSKGDQEQPTAPWSGYQNEEELKEKIIALSEDKRNFLRAPPSGVNFDFEYSGVAAHALVLLQEDSKLEKLRYELVPKKIKEDDFWRNYFYRVGLLKQSFELSNNMTTDSKKSSVPVIDPLSEDENITNSGNQDDEFVSELHQASSKDIKEADEAMRKLGLGKNDAEWEAELEGELNEYEMVGDDSGDGTADENPEWENQIQEMLEAETTK